MKKALLFQCFFVLAVIAKGQSYIHFLKTKPKAELEADIQKSLQNIKNDTAGDFNNFRYGVIANSYLALGNEQMAELYYRKLMREEEFDMTMAKRRYLPYFASILLKKGQPDSVLYYYSLVEKSKPRRYGCGNTIRAVMPVYRYWQMAALDAKGMTDSAVKLFMPYAFDEWTNSEGTELSTEHLFENDYHCQVIHFINILLKRACLDELIDNVMAFTKKSNVQAANEVIDGKNIPTLHYYLKLGPYTHDYLNWSYITASEIGQIQENMISYIKNSFIYRYLLGLKNISNSPTHPLISPFSNL